MFARGVLAASPGIAAGTRVVVTAALERQTGGQPAHSADWAMAEAEEDESSTCRTM